MRADPRRSTARLLDEPPAPAPDDAPGPAPSAQPSPAGPATSLEGALAEVLAEALRLAAVPVEAHVFDDLGADSMVMAQFCARVRKRADLPPVSMKDVYRHPTMRALAAALAPPAGEPVEGLLAEVLADVLGVESVSVDAHVFDDLGADSMVMARFCARVRKRPELPPVSMREVYRSPTLRELAAALARPARPVEVSPTAAPSPAPSTGPRDRAGAPSGTGAPAAPAGTAAYVLCGVLQVLILLAYTYLGAVVLAGGYKWIAAGAGAVEHYLRSLVVGGAAFLGLSVLPVLVKWVLVGRWKPGEIQIWSLAYVRFWVVKTLVRTSPLVRFTGSPLYVLYLRALGARIGPRVAIFSRTVPVCTDLLTIGADTVVRKDSVFACYRAHAGVIQTGAVTLGRHVVVSEATVLDIDTAMGDGAQLGHASALHAGQVVPPGQSWHGSPAEPAGVDYRGVEPAQCSSRRRLLYPMAQLLAVLTVYVPLTFGGVTMLFDVFPALATVLETGGQALTGTLFWVEALAVSLVLYAGRALGGLVVAMTVPRLLARVVVPDRVYPLYGLHYSFHRTVTRLSNNRFWAYLLSDSSFIVGYLRRLGYDLEPVQQTGSNFSGVVHETPYLVRVGTGTMVADGLSVNNAEYSSASFRVSRATIGPRNFLGNAIAYPSGGRTGDNCLLATKVMVPTHGPVREGVGLLGSPAFEIPRSVLRDGSFAHLESGDEFAGRLAAKNRHNLRTIGLLLLVRWLGFFGLTVIALAGVSLHERYGAVAVAVAACVDVVFLLAWSLFWERAVTGFRRMSPRFVSIYDPYFWWHERFWKLVAPNPAVLAGTPFAAVYWRLAGVRVGRRLFDDGAAMPERSLVTIGDDCTLNAGAAIQCHSQEDGAFKSDRIRIGSRCTIGVGARVHYGVTLGDDTVLAADSFLMKGEEVPAGGHWGGNPAEDLRPPPPSVYVPRQRVEAPSETSGPVAGPPGAALPPLPPPPQLTGLLAELRLGPVVTPDASTTVELVSLAAARSRQPELQALLPLPKARRGADEVPGERDGLVAEGVLRAVLTARCAPGVGPAQWVLRCTGTGQRLAVGPDGPALHATVSIHDDVVAVAVCASAAVGVDVAGESDHIPVAWEALGPSERSALTAAPPAERRSRFLQMWTLKRAYAAAASTDVPLRRLVTGAEPPCVRRMSPRPSQGHWWFHQERLVLGGRPHWLALARQEGAGQEGLGGSDTTTEPRSRHGKDEPDG